MRRVGVFPGKFCPLHRGHISSIIQAATKVDLLFVVVSYRDIPEVTQFGGLHVTMNMIKLWLQEQFKDLDHIKIITIDETWIPPYPEGWEVWANMIVTELYRNDVTRDNAEDYSIIWKLHDEPVKMILFGGEPEYKEGYEHHFAPSTYNLFDPNRKRFAISATNIRENVYNCWPWLPTVVRKNFVKKVLITGTESCGKTTLTRYLAKIYNTSRSEEVGRDYAQHFLGGDETLFTEEDFLRIHYLQKEQDRRAIETANKIVFVDTDVVVTNYYAELYIHERPWILEKLMSYYCNQWDLILLLKPDVQWVPDGQRMNGEQKRREELHERIKRLYELFGMGYVEIHGDYNTRLEQSISILQHIFPDIYL